MLLWNCNKLQMRVGKECDGALKHEIWQTENNVNAADKQSS